MAPPLIVLNVHAKDPSLVSCTHSSQPHSVYAVLGLKPRALYLIAKCSTCSYQVNYTQALGSLGAQSVGAEKAGWSEWHVAVLVGGGRDCLVV